MSFIIYQDRRIIVCIKPCGVLSTDEQGGMPELIRRQLGDMNACVRTVHRLDRVVSGLMVFARSAKASQILSKQIQQHEFEKEYMAVIHGTPPNIRGVFEDLLVRSKSERKTYVTTQPGKDVVSARLSYNLLQTVADTSLVRIRLETGRTHQIRCQFASRGLPLLGDRKYGLGDTDECENIALWSCRLSFTHPETGQIMNFTQRPPEESPWNKFDEANLNV
jgi:23S rRNA pseudouridine1911/1915/1917 synthase